MATIDGTKENVNDKSKVDVLLSVSLFQFYTDETLLFTL